MLLIFSTHCSTLHLPSDVDRPPEPESPASVKKRVLCGGSTSALEKVLKFGRDLQLFYLRLRADQGESDYNKNLLQVCPAAGGMGRSGAGVGFSRLVRRQNVAVRYYCRGSSCLPVRQFVNRVRDGVFLMAASFFYKSREAGFAVN